jgi:drug/metabolite transporter (DMT)-like permease
VFVLSLVVVMIFWGSAFASSKVAVGTVGHEVAAPLRFGLGALVLLLVLPFARGPGPGRNPGDWLALTGLGLVGVFGYNLLFFLGLSLAPAADGSMIIPVLSPVITTVLGALLGNQRISAVQIAGLSTAVAGAVVFMAGAPLGPAGMTRLAGDAAFVGAAACWSTYTVLGRPMLHRLSPQRVTTYTTAIGSLGLVPVAVPSATQVSWSTLDTGFWLNVAYLAIFPTALAYVLYYRGVHQLGSTTAATMMFLVPIAGLACAIGLLGESINPAQIVGSILMLGGALVATRASSSARSKQPAPRV